MREPADEYREAWVEGTSKAIDALHNSGWLAGGVAQATAQICGPMLALNARPDPLLFGGNAQAAEWARGVEKRFTAWAKNPYSVDITGRQSLGQMCAQSMKTWFGTGEICGVVRYKKREGNTHGTKIQIIPSSRIPQGARNPRAQQGVILDGDGYPTAYCIENYNPSNPGVREEIEVQARDKWGRLVVIHVHDSPPTVIRGITCMMPVLQVIRQYDQLTNATMTAALLQAIFAATVESDAPTDEVLKMLQTDDEQTDQISTSGFDGFMQARAEWYQNTKIDLGQFGKIVHMFPKEKLNFLRSEHPNQNYKPAAKLLLLEIAKCLGITYEQLTGDREGATYSSERMGGAENWLLTSERRNNVPARLMQIAYESWLEEDIELGGTPFPGGIDGFYAERDRAVLSDWRGPPKPTADDLKTSKANEVKLANKIITREMWCAEEGVDWEDVFEQLQQENDRADELEIDLAPPAAKGAFGQDPNADPNADPEADPVDPKEK
jgi:lambda family phage portal protein